jgi:hypothetical protein
MEKAPEVLTATHARRKFNSLWGRMQTPDDARKVVKESAYAFYFVAGIQGLVGIFFAPSLLVDGVIFAVLAFLLHKRSSRAAAVMLCVLSVIAICSTLLNIFGDTGIGGNNIVLAIIMVWISVRAIQATYLLRKMKDAVVAPPAAPDPSI